MALSIIVARTVPHGSQVAKERGLARREYAIITPVNWRHALRGWAATDVIWAMPEDEVPDCVIEQVGYSRISA